MVARPGALSNVFDVRITNVSIYGKRRKAKMKKPKKKRKCRYDATKNSKGESLRG